MVQEKKGDGRALGPPGHVWMPEGRLEGLMAVRVLIWSDARGSCTSWPWLGERGPGERETETELLASGLRSRILGPAESALESGRVLWWPGDQHGWTGARPGLHFFCLSSPSVSQPQTTRALMPKRTR